MTGAASGTRARERGQVYALMSAIFRRPLDAAQLARLRSAEMLAALAAAGIDPGPDFADADPGALREALAVDFTHIFHAPVGKVLPYEGILIGHEAQFRGARTQAVERFMAGVGYRVPPEAGEMADHVAVELAFLADLATREGDAIDAGDAALAAESRRIQHDFIATHLGTWIGILARRIEARAEGRFYPAIARFTADFIAAEEAAPAAEAVAAEA